MRAIAFGGRAGWLHEGRSRRGVVVCASLGLEELCGRRTLHLLAERLAAAGLPTLRFDYRGEADSLGDAEDADCVLRWRDDVTAAIEYLRRDAGVSEIALVGMRFGALLAAEIAAGRDDVTHAALVAPVAAGKTWLRETRILARMIETEAPDAHAPRRDDLGLAGFSIMDETAAALGAMTIEGIARRPAPAIMLVEPASGRAGAKIAAHLEALGASVARADFPGYEQMMCDPALSTPAEAILDPLVQWLAAGAESAPAIARAGDAGWIDGDAWREQGVLIGAGPLAGVWCEPVGRAPSRTVVFAGPGNNHHIGWGRSHVELARALARGGVASLRFDYAGVGDSAGRRTDIYDSARGVDIAAAVDWAAAKGDGRISIVGVCSGAYHSLRLAARDARIERLVLLNQLRYELDMHHRLSWLAYTLQARLVFALDAKDKSPLKARALAAALAALPWIRRVGSVANRAIRRLKGQKDGAAPSGPNKTERNFGAISRRGARILIVHSPGDPAIVEIERFMGPDGAKATALPGVARIVLADADHLLSSRAARQAYTAEAIRFLT